MSACSLTQLSWRITSKALQADKTSHDIDARKMKPSTFVLNATSHIALLGVTVERCAYRYLVATRAHPCFQSHRTCSEGFYRSSIVEEIRSSPQHTHDEKRSMLEILQRVADETEVSHSEEEIDDDDDEALSRKLEGVNIGA